MSEKVLTLKTNSEEYFLHYYYDFFWLCDKKNKLCNLHFGNHFPDAGATAVWIWKVFTFTNKLVVGGYFFSQK